MNHSDVAAAAISSLMDAPSSIPEHSDEAAAAAGRLGCAEYLAIGAGPVPVLFLINDD